MALFTLFVLLRLACTIQVGYFGSKLFSMNTKCSTGVQLYQMKPVVLENMGVWLSKNEDYQQFSATSA